MENIMHFECPRAHHQHFRPGSSRQRKLNLHFVIVFIINDLFLARHRLVNVMEKRSLTNIFRHIFR